MSLSLQIIYHNTSLHGPVVKAGYIIENNILILLHLSNNSMLILLFISYWQTFASGNNKVF